MSEYPTYIGYSDGACALTDRCAARTGGWGFTATIGISVVMGSGDVSGVQTNNRAEILAAIACLKVLAAAKPPGVVTLVTDSTLVIGLAETWYNKRRQEGTLSGLKNLDLAKLLCDQADAVRAVHRKLIFRHVRGHQPEPPAGAPITQRADWLGNDNADKLATQFVAHGNPVREIVLMPDVTQRAAIEDILASL